MNLKYANNPTIKFVLSELSDFTDITKIMKSNGIIYYVYAFVTDRGVVKYGYSADAFSNWGERIYRQAGHLLGWSRRLNGSSGSDMRVISDNYYAKYNEVLDRNKVTIYVIDMSHLPEPDCQNPELQCKILERSLINQCINNSNGQAPIGNVDQETKMNGYVYRNTKKFNELFEIIE